MFENISNFIQKHFKSIFSKSPKKFSGIVVCGDRQSLEQEVQNGKIVIIGNKNNPKWVHFLCPCGCKEQISLNLMKSYYPRWRVKFNQDDTVSISPSIDNTSCGGHFWIDHNQVFWAKYNH